MTSQMNLEEIYIELNALLQGEYKRVKNVKTCTILSKDMSSVE